MDFLYSQFFVTPKSPSQSFTDQTVIISGSNVGLGLEAARHIVRLNAAKVILAVRNVPAGNEAKKSIEESTGRANVCEVWELDMASYDSVIAFGERVSKLERLDVVLENAALGTQSFHLAEGHERSITVNVISTFLLALLVLPKLRESANRFGIRPRLTLVTSEVHAWARMPDGRVRIPLSLWMMSRIPI